uniref:Purple acid phosphatase n=1 Tax=Ixodes scapularis TaxID=6945 RepID=A0A4D5RKI2_IXOSC
MALTVVQAVGMVVLVLVGETVVGAVLYVEPEQIHLSYGVDPTQMIVTWTTFNETHESVVEFGQASLDQRALGNNSTKFKDGGTEHRVIFIHRVTLNGLQPGSLYRYHCGSNMGWSSLFFFRAMRSGQNWSPRLAVFGDMGNVNAQSLPFLQEEAQKGTIDAVLHVGDFAYDMDSDNARVGDEFMRQIEPVAAYVPYMTCVGNHENSYNFSNYVNRFSMVDKSGNINNHFFSLDIGPAHIISLSTEFYFFVEYGNTQIANQYNWLEEDLKEATKPENRAKRPWIITMGHRPMYCSNEDRNDCTFNESIIRKGIPLVHLFGLEDLFYKYGVDLEFWAHEHSYERLWPVYDRKVYNGSYDKPYTNPGAPVHITTGSAGCQEHLNPFKTNPANWSAVRYKDYGYTVMTIHNRTHLNLKQFSAEKEGQILDEITIVKNYHGPYFSRA